MFSLQARMFILMSLMFAIVYAVVTMVMYTLGVSNFGMYLALTIGLMLIQYMIGPKMVEWSMRVKYVSAEEYPELFTMVRQMAEKARIPMPRIGISDVNIPNAFAFGRWKSDGRVCVTRGILNLLSAEELQAVLGHELSHLKNRDVLTITLLSVIPMILYRLAWHLLFYPSRRRGKDSGQTALIGLAALVLYFVTNLLVLYGSRIREYFADRGSVELGNQPRYLASALYKLVYGNARADRDEVRSVAGLKAFFVNDPGRAAAEFRELKELDVDHSGTLDTAELRRVREVPLRLSMGDRLMEVFSTHPNMLKRIKTLSSYLNA